MCLVYLCSHCNMSMFMILYMFFHSVLRDRIFFLTLARIKKPHWMRRSDFYWLNVDDLGPGSIWVEEWNAYSFYLNKSTIKLRDIEDKMVWCLNPSTCQATTKVVYSKLSNYLSILDPKWCIVKFGSGIWH